MRGMRVVTEKANEICASMSPITKSSKSTKMAIMPLEMSPSIISYKFHHTVIITADLEIEKRDDVAWKC